MDRGMAQDGAWLFARGTYRTWKRQCGDARDAAYRSEHIELFGPYKHESVLVIASERVVAVFVGQSLGDGVAIDIKAGRDVEHITLAHFLEDRDVDAGLHRAADPVHAFGPRGGLSSRAFQPGARARRRVVGEGALGLQVGDLEGPGSALELGRGRRRGRGRCRLCRRGTSRRRRGSCRRR